MASPRTSSPMELFSITRKRGRRSRDEFSSHERSRRRSEEGDRKKGRKREGEEEEEEENKQRKKRENIVRERRYFSLPCEEERGRRAYAQQKISVA